MAKSASAIVVKVSIIAALYASATLSIAPISFGPVQFRASNILYGLSLIDPVFSIGFCLGCFLSNLTSPFGALDFLLMPIITGVACYSAWSLRRWPIIALCVLSAIISLGVSTIPLGLGANLPVFITLPGIAIQQIILVIGGWYIIWNKFKGVYVRL